MDWTFRLPTRIRFGDEAFAAIDEEVGNRRALVISSPGFRSRGGVRRIEVALGGRCAEVLTVSPNPDVEGIVGLREASAALEFEVIVAIGGGSVIDAAKVLGAGRDSWASTEEAMRTFLATGGKPLKGGAAIPVITVPTTSGTGAEVTPFATVWDNRLRRKFSVDGLGLHPEAAVVDPRMTIGLPEDVTISTGLDAISQALESIWNRRANPMTTAIAIQSLVRSLEALPRLVANPADDEARTPMALGSLLAGVAISQTRTGIAHSISYPLTAHYGVPHGIACSFTLPAILERNLPHDDGRFRALANALGLRTTDELSVKVQTLASLCDVKGRLLAGVPSAESVFALQNEMFTPGRADNNFAPIDRAALEDILERSFRDDRSIPAAP